MSQSLVFSNKIVRDLVGGDKLSWRTISEWLAGLGALKHDAPVPQALADGLAYAHVLNAIEPGIARIGAKERKSSFLAYVALKQAMMRLGVHAGGQNIAECIHWSLAPEWTPQDHLHFCGLLHSLSGQRALGASGSDSENYVRLQDLIEVRAELCADNSAMRGTCATRAAAARAWRACSTRARALITACRYCLRPPRFAAQPDERNRLLRRRVDQLQSAHRALTDHCDSYVRLARSTRAPTRGALPRVGRRR
jgi:hypothetical protein